MQFEQEGNNLKDEGQATTGTLIKLIFKYQLCVYKVWNLQIMKPSWEGSGFEL